MLVAGCGSGGAQCSNPSQVSGVWSGTTDDQTERGLGTVRVAFTQTECQLGGTWQTVFSEPGTSAVQTVQGSVDGTELHFTIMAASGKGCRTTVAGTLVSPTEILGTYATGVCGESDSGSFDITFTGPLPTPTVTPTVLLFSTPTPTPTPQ